MLFAAARSDHIQKRIKPALEAGTWVISDRFIDSSRAYQGASLGLGDDLVMKLHDIGSDGLLPDRTIILDLPLDEGRRRADQRDGGDADRIGRRSDAFHQSVGQAFRRMAEAEPARIRLVDANGKPDKIAERIFAEIADMLP